MYLQRIELRDWKAYESADFDFPEPTAEQNIVLIGARNGYGKTSLYQAIILCMFGQDGMALVTNSVFSKTENTRTQPYKAFLEKAIYKGATAKGRYSCSVKLVFKDDDKPIEISRIWHFNDSGGYLSDDEEIQIFNDKNPIGPPENLQRNERNDWYNHYIGQTFLPHQIASFFVFDGEQVRILAQREMKDQVKKGIDELLGIPDLRNLSENLNEYANQRQSNIPSVTDKKIKTAQEVLKQLNGKLNKIKEQHDYSHPNLESKQKQHSQILEELLALGVGPKTQSNQIYKDLAKYDTVIKEGGRQLKKLLSEDIALALAGSGLRKKLKNRLESENVRANWESGKQQGDSRIQNFLDAMDQQMDNIEPSISDAQQADVLKIAAEAWVNLWFPPPYNCAEKYFHPYFSVHERGIVIDKLNNQDSLGAAEIVSLLDSIAENEYHLKRISDEIARIEAIKPELDEKLVSLKKLQSEIDSLTKKVGGLESERKGLDGQVAAKTADLARMYKNIEDAKPSLRRAACAREVVTILGKIISKSVPEQMKKIADEMTKAHRKMAHKKDLIHRIDIDDGDVKLLNEQGNDVRGNDLSAGEEQIFTQSLFSAVSAVSKRAFPMVVDTPLSRLDENHRKGVLRHLAQRGEQVILLSTDTEVVGTYLQEIDPHIQQKYLIKYRLDGDIGRSTVTQGYFDDSETAA